MVLKLSKKVQFLQFCADCSKKSMSVKQFTHMCLKGLVKFFQKTVFFIVLWVTVPKILEVKVKEFC